MSRSRPSCCLSLLTSATTSPRTIVELFHTAVSSVEENTYLGMALILSAQGSVRLGQIAAKLSYVFRPINSASHASAWPNPSCIYASSRYAENPARAAPAKTPSNETMVYSIIFRIRQCPFTFHLSCERYRSPFTYRTPVWSQTHRKHGNTCREQLFLAILLSKYIVNENRPWLFWREHVSCKQHFPSSSPFSR